MASIADNGLEKMGFQIASNIYSLLVSIQALWE